MTLPPSKHVACRMPIDLLNQLDDLGLALGMTRTQLFEISLRVLVRQAKTRGGEIAPPYTDRAAAEAVQRAKERIARQVQCSRKS